MGIFQNAQGQFTPQSIVQMGYGWLAYKLIRDIMVVIVTYMNEDLIKIVGARVLTSFPPFQPMGALCFHGKQNSDLTCIKT